MDHLPVFNFGSRACCAYCGDPAETRDHVIAVSYQTSIKRRLADINGPWCWACKDCNVHLSNRYFDSFKARCEWACYRLKLKVKPINWHDWELEKMDYTIQTYIKNDLAKRRLIQARADFYQCRDFYLNIESLIWEVSKLKTGPVGHQFLRAYFSSMLADIAMIYEH